MTDLVARIAAQIERNQGVLKMDLNLALIPSVKSGKCQDIWCEEPETSDLLTRVTYINSNKTGAWICQGCLEGWSDALEEHCANMVDFDLPDAYPFIP